MVKKPILFTKLRDHFKKNPAKLPIIEQTYGFYERANLHLAIEDILQSAKQPPSLTGIVMIEDSGHVNLAKLSRRTTAEDFDEGPVEYRDEPMPHMQRLSCVKRGLYLFHFGKTPLALLIYEQHYSYRPGITVEIMSPSKEVGEQFAHRLTRKVREGKAFRGHVLSLTRDCYGSMQVAFHNLPPVSREEVILPTELLDRIERHTISFSKHAKRLVAAGRHLKRGVLLHGPPGTGKTFSAMYLASQMPGRTVILLTGATLGSIEIACNMARMLEPSTVILEDVDLIGTQRERQMVDANALLFELLNQMDGLSEDADVLFLLTTNRPDVLEPALAARPGRIDQAIAVPPPDEDCRRRLFTLYSQGMTTNVDHMDELIQRTEGVSAAFIRELLRKAAVFAAMDSDEEIVVQDKHIQEALAELLVAGGTLTQSLLGARRDSVG